MLSEPTKTGHGNGLRVGSSVCRCWNRHIVPDKPYTYSPRTCSVKVEYFHAGIAATLHLSIVIAVRCRWCHGDIQIRRECVAVRGLDVH